MKKKNLIVSVLISCFSIVTLFIMFMPILDLPLVDTNVFDLVGAIDKWYLIEEYLWGIAGLISTICLPILFVSSVLCILSACGVIKNKKLDKFLYILNIVLALLVVLVIVNYFLGFGRTIGKSGLKLFQGPTYFDHVSAFFYLHSVFSVILLVLACLNKKCKKKRK